MIYNPKSQICSPRGKGDDRRWLVVCLLMSNLAKLKKSKIVNLRVVSKTFNETLQAYITTDLLRVNRKWFNCVLCCGGFLMMLHRNHQSSVEQGMCAQSGPQAESDSYSERDFRCPLYHHSNQGLLMTTEAIGRAHTQVTGKPARSGIGLKLLVS